MNGKIEFLEKLRDLVELAQKQGSQITIEEVTKYFSEESLTAEQMELVYDYLLAQKVAVRGYMKMESVSKSDFSEEEKAYLKEYLAEIDGLKQTSSEEAEILFEKAAGGDESAKSRLVEIYLNEVVEIAKQMHREDVFLGDLVQEGNLGLVLGVEMITGAFDAHDVILTQIKQSMQMLLEEQTELSKRDKKMVEKVTLLDEAIKNLTEELGRKVAIDELAVYMGMEIEEIEDILKLTGEEPEEN